MRNKKRYRRHKRIRAKISGTRERPRLCVFRSAKHIYAQLIDDESGKTLVAASDRGLKIKNQKSKIKTTDQNSKLVGKMLKAYEVGKLLAQKALANKITKVVFDRGGYRYHGRVKALAEGAREGGLVF